MVLGIRPLIEALKAPMPTPFLVVESEVVGLTAVPQQTPRAVMVAPPSAVISPPQFTEVLARAEGAVVESVGKRSSVPFLEAVPQEKNSCEIAPQQRNK